MYDFVRPLPSPFQGRVLALIGFLLLPLCTAVLGAAQAIDCDVVVYGTTSAGVMASVQAKRMGKSVVLVGPDRHLGGLSSGGLGWTDLGNKAAIGGLAREFYQRIAQHYASPSAWTWQSAGAYGPSGREAEPLPGQKPMQWTFEPHVAEAVFEDFVQEAAVPVDRDEWLDRQHGVRVEDGRIVSITTLSGRTYRAKMFIDATYEGDLMAAAGVSYRVGRESNREYAELHNGSQPGLLHHRHNFSVLSAPVSAYVVPGDPASGLVVGVSASAPLPPGEGDNRVQAYCFRLCLTDNPDNRVPFEKPPGYDPRNYELLVRIYAAGWNETFEKFDPVPNRKTDANNHGPFSFDYIGGNYDYPNADYERRREIIADHENYQRGWLYFCQTDPRIPAAVRENMSRWGLAKDEFVGHRNWPHQLYIRESRRMVGNFVMTESQLMKSQTTPESVGMGSYMIDSHNVQRYVATDGSVQNEGDVGVKPKGPYAIAFGALMPKRSEVRNLLVPVCVSSTHIAYGSIRMEPVFMILGQSAATAAVLALERKIAVQDLLYSALRDQLLADRQVLALEP